MFSTSYNVICQLPTKIMVVKYKEGQNIVVLCCLQLSSKVLQVLLSNYFKIDGDNIFADEENQLFFSNHSCGKD